MTKNGDGVITKIEHVWTQVRRMSLDYWRRSEPLRRQARIRIRKMSLGTRLLIVLVSIASISTLLTVAMQDSALSRDLEAAARARLERASDTASQILEDHLWEQVERYRAIAHTPQFVANLESDHVPTLTHYAAELAKSHKAAVILFVDKEGKEIAGFGPSDLRAQVRPGTIAGRIAAVATSGSKGVGQPPRGDYLTFEGSPWSRASIPLRLGAVPLGRLVSVEAVTQQDLLAWSRLCSATLSFGPKREENALSMPARALGPYQFRVATTFDAEARALANSRRNLFTGGLLGLALACAASLFLARNLVRPIRAIQRAALRIADGDLESRLRMDRGDEVGEVARALNLMLDHLQDNIRERLRFEKQISHLAYHDSLTGLGNRLLLREKLTTALERIQGQDSAVAVIFMDLDRFKNVNDTMGHTAGDELLTMVAQRLDDCVRAVDFAAEGSHVETLLARLGGDEFTLVLTDVTRRSQIETLAESILESLSMPFDLRGQEVTLSASLGIALAPHDAQDVETLLRDSDMAMFHAKNQGGRGYEFYADSMEEIAAKRLDLENRLQRALEKDEFELFYQPKVDVQSGCVTGVEALLRWRDPRRGLICPDEFIPMAEETGVIIPIGDWVLREAMEQMKSWQDEGLPPLRVAVNVSARQIDPRLDFVGKVERLLAETGLDPKLLDLEITEGALLTDEETAIPMFQQLRNVGVGLSLDDFGTGYSSLSYLRTLPIDTLKIDRSFIQCVDTNPSDAALVGTIIAMARVLGLRVVVEGVETRNQQAFLVELGCDEIQGFLYSEPISAEETTAILREKKASRARQVAAAKA